MQPLLLWIDRKTARYHRDVSDVRLTCTGRQSASSQLIGLQEGQHGEDRGGTLDLDRPSYLELRTCSCQGQHFHACDSEETHRRGLGRRPPRPTGRHRRLHLGGAITSTHHQQQRSGMGKQPCDPKLMPSG